MKVCFAQPNQFKIGQQVCTECVNYIECFQSWIDLQVYHSVKKERVENNE